MSPAFLSTGRRFARNREGNVAILFGLMAVPLFLFAGGAVDFNRFIRYQAQMQGAVDSAALALSRQDPDKVNPQQFAEDYIKAVMAAEIGGTSPALTIDEMDGIDAQIDAATNTATVNVSATMTTSFLGLAQIDTLDINLGAQVEFVQQNVDVVIVADVTGSMEENDRIGNMRNAGAEFVTQLAGLARVPGQIQVGVVPYTNTVNIKTEGFNEDWIDRSGRAQYNGHFFRHPDDPTPPTRAETSHFRLFQSLRLRTQGFDQFGTADDEAFDVHYGFPNRAWKGCVEARGGAVDGSAQNTGVNGVNSTSYDLTDVAPDQDVSNTLFVPYFAPDEPGPSVGAPRVLKEVFANSYIDDGVTEADIALEVYNGTTTDLMWREIANFSKYEDRDVTLEFQSSQRGNTHVYRNPGPNRACPEPLLDLTDIGNQTGLNQVLGMFKDPGRVTSPGDIDGMAIYDGGGTNTVLGAAWGWRVLSPGEPFDARKADINSPLQKYLVIMTDGFNQVAGSHGSDRLASGDYSSYGYKANFDETPRPHRLASIGSAANQHIDERMLALCDNIKTEINGEKDIIVYTATIEVNNAGTQQLFTDCASVGEDGQPLYRNLQSGQIDDFFDDILADIAAVRLTN